MAGPCVGVRDPGFSGSGSPLVRVGGVVGRQRQKTHVNAREFEYIECRKRGAVESVCGAVAVS